MSRTTKAFEEWIASVRTTIDLRLASNSDTARDRYQCLDTDWLWMAFHAGQQCLSGRVSRTDDLARQLKTVSIEVESLRSFKARVLLATEQD